MNTPRIIDYTVQTRRPGHDYTFRPEGGGREAEMTGWGPRSSPRLKVGDILVLTNFSSESSVAPYRITAIGYAKDPSDMWSARVEFVPDVLA